MREIIDKISSYNLFNYLFPGILFVVLLQKFTSYNLLQEDIVEGVFLYYFIGLLINRIGSLIVEPILTHFKFIKFRPPEEYRRASKLYPKIEIFSEINNMFRGMCATFLALIVLVISEQLGLEVKISYMPDKIIIILLLFIILLFSYRKQTKIMLDRIEDVISQKGNTH